MNEKSKLFKILWRILGFTAASFATILACLMVAYLNYPTQFGRAWANFDLMRNHYEVRYFGLTFMDDVMYFQFMDHGIKYVRVAWCVVNIPIIESKYILHVLPYSILHQKVGHQDSHSNLS